ncbi:MAG: Formate hydrogenlyase subunit 5 precursor [bacterium ADurb.Bin429]|nr:MAG: Formate hydrogenlyase subunit 5 precursor [bacterium ADurb.Bin429]
MTTTRVHHQIETTPFELSARTKALLTQPGMRYGHLTARSLDEARVAIDILLLDTAQGQPLLLTAPLEAGTCEYPALTPAIPAAHWAERMLGDFFGLHAVGHPRWKSLLLHDDRWPMALCPLAGAEQATLPRTPYRFLKVEGEGIHEIPVGPIHAGIIEPGHFRFSCLGEIVTNLEIRLGYQHRGIEKRLTEVPWHQSRFLAESASSDTAAGNALAHATAIEQLLGITPPSRAIALRTLALEIERLANHLGDMGALCGDIGYSPGAALFPPLRGAALALAQFLTGNRRQRWFIQPGGVVRDLDAARRRALLHGVTDLAKQAHEHLPLVLEHSGVLERMEGAGRLSPALARDFGIVGPAGRASGTRYDIRRHFVHAAYPALAPVPAHRETGDVLARAQIKAEEIGTSLDILTHVLETLPDSPIDILLPDRLPAHAVGIGIVEAWRGELIHWITTGEAGAITRYAIKDPSFNNWTGLAIAIRGNLVADFPLCNKSFNLSYSGNDM